MKTGILSKNVLSKAWDSNSLKDLGGWLELVNIDPTKIFSSKNIKDHEYIGKKVYLKEIDKAGYDGVAVIENCLIHPSGKLLFDIRFNQPVPDFFITSKGVTLLTHRKADSEINRVTIGQLQSYFLEILD